MAVGGTATIVGADTSSRFAPASFTLHRQYNLQQQHYSRDQRKRQDLLDSSVSTLASMVSSAHHARPVSHHHHPHQISHHQQAHRQTSMLSTQSAYYTAALVNQTAAAAAVASTQLLVHHPDYHHLNGHSFHHHQSTSQLIQQYPSNAVSNLIHGPASISPSSSDSASIITDLTPDRPIGYGAFGVVWSVTDPRDGKRVALKKMPNVFQNLISSKRVFREMKMLCFFKHENVLSALDILQPPMVNFFQEIYVITELMESDLHKIIVSSQPLTTDHIKVFLYQILRGLKYLHSARILHRDIKPGNLLVNSNCLLKICDFGLARVEERDRSRKMTQEVVTQYYRAPELLMGARYYTEAIDMWSVGCIFAELLGRRILFQAQTPIQQLDLITDLLGTPSHEDMRYACEPARQHVLRQAYKLPRLVQLSNLSSLSSNEATHLLVQMLAFNPDKRINCTSALNHSYLSEGRARYHSCMCKCCSNSGTGETRRFVTELEPVAPAPFDNSFEKELTSVQIVKERLHKEIMERCESSNRVPLCINPMSASFKNFASSSVAHPSELPPSPHCWE